MQEVLVLKTQPVLLPPQASRLSSACFFLSIGALKKRFELICLYFIKKGRQLIQKGTTNKNCMNFGLSLGKNILII
jgi:hypothetical protein